MKDYYQQSVRALQLAGMSQPTRKDYTRLVRVPVDYCGKTPDLITEQELRDYFPHRKNVDKWSAAAMRVCYSGIKFFFVNVLRRVLKQLNIKKRVSIHTLRHSYATHLLEAGVNIRRIRGNTALNI